MRIARGQNVVYAMTTRAVRGNNRPALGSEAMVAVHVCRYAIPRNSKLARQPHTFMATSTRITRQVLFRYRRVRIVMRLDGVDPVAVGARRSLPVAVREGGSMDTPLEFFSDRLVALAAGCGHIEFEDWGFRIFCIKDFVPAVAVGAHRRFFRAVRDGVSMHALLIGGDHLLALAAVRHHKLLAVACAASGRNVGVTYARFWIGRRQQFVRAAVAVDARRCIVISSRNGLGVVTAVVSRLLVSVAGRTTDFFGSRLVRGALYVGVAIDAAEHAAVNGILESFRIDVQADRLAIDLVA